MTASGTGTTSTLMKDLSLHSSLGKHLWADNHTWSEIVCFLFVFLSPFYFPSPSRGFFLSLEPSLRDSSRFGSAFILAYFYFAHI